MWFGLYKKGKCFVVHTHQPTWTVEFCSKIQHTHKASKSFAVTCITSIYLYTHHMSFSTPTFSHPPYDPSSDTVKAALKVMRSACRSGSRCKFSSCCKAWRMTTTRQLFGEGYPPVNMAAMAGISPFSIGFLHVTTGPSSTGYLGFGESCRKP